MTLTKTLYNVFLRRNAVYIAFMFTGAFALEQAIDKGVENYWAIHNQGKLWSQVEPVLREKGLLVESVEAEEEEEEEEAEEEADEE